MITLIHGDDLVASRKKLEEEKKQDGTTEIIYLDGTKLTLPDLVSACGTKSLFGNQKVILIENLLLKGITKDKLELISYLGKSDISYPVIIWENREVQKTTVKKYFAKAKEIRCQPPLLVWRFLDSIGVQPSNQLLPLFHAVLEQREAELIFALFLHKFRYLIIASDLGKKGLAELSPWQINKLMYQSRYFSTEKLINLYRLLLSFDYKIKSGQTPYALSQLLDIFLATL